MRSWHPVAPRAFESDLRTCGFSKQGVCSCCALARCMGLQQSSELSLQHTAVRQRELWQLGLSYAGAGWQGEAGEVVMSKCLPTVHLYLVILALSQKVLLTPPL